MFGFLKDKLKKAVAAFSKSAESEVKEEQVEAPVEKPAQRQAPPIKTQQPPKPVEKKATPTETPKPQPAKPKEQPAKPSLQPAETTAPKKVEVPIQEIPAAPQPEPVVTPKPVPVPEPEHKKGLFGKLFGKKEAAPVKEEVVAQPAPITTDVEKPAEDEEQPQEGFLGKLRDSFTKKTLGAEKFDELFWELEVAMLENNVAVEVIEKIKADLKDELTSGKVSRLGIDEMIKERLHQSIEELFSAPTFDLLQKIRAGPKPYKICIIGVNGSGKTTTLAKLIKLLQDNKLSVVVAASDTFRAAAIDQLQVHTDKLGVKLISQGYGADPAAVAFDAIKHAESKKVDVVLIDTAGRLHSNTNLMAELQKVVRVAKPDLKIFVGESITGNDCVEQAKVFDKLVGIDAIILSKADIDEKGGAAISVSYVTGKPILYLGTGQTYGDLQPFDKQKIIRSLEL